MKKRPVIFLVGPTATGKSDLAVRLAKEFNGEIVNGDSQQIYKEVSIGTAKPSAEEFKGIENHLYDFQSIYDNFSVALFRKLAFDSIDEIHKKGKIPIIVGGSGFYLNSILYESSLGVSKDNNYEKLEKRLTLLSSSDLIERLNKVDRVSAQKIALNNRRRLIRAILVSELTGNPFSNQGDTFDTRYDALIIGLNSLDRSVLYNRINERADKMMRTGLLKEVEMIWKNKENIGQIKTAIGYKEFFDYFEELQNIDVAVEKVKKDSRHYAKRQITWFNNKLPTKWIYIDQPNVYGISANMIEEFKEKRNGKI